MDISGNRKCFVCNHDINWMATISEGQITAFTIPNNTAVGEAIAINRVTTTDGPKPLYEIEVKCPHCRNKNRFSN